VKPFKEAPGFDRDLQVAYDFYKTYSPATAAKFLSSYERAVAIIQSSPYVCRPRRHGWRQMVIHEYPAFSIFYREFDAFWLFAGVVSTVQDPDVILARLLIREIESAPS
jgi:plasmid stabilization system protein ParE